MQETPNTPLGAVLQLRADERDPNRQRAQITADWGQGRAMFGGLIAALGVRALDSVNQGRSLRALSVTFCAPAEAGELAIDIELLRSGRALLHAQARLVQHGQVRAVIIGAYGDARESSLHYAARRAPEAPDPASLPRMAYVDGAMPAFLRHFDHRWPAESTQTFPLGGGQLGGFARTIDADRIDAAVVTAIADAFPAPVMTLMQKHAPASTASWLLNFVGEPIGPAKIDREAFWQFAAQTLDAGHGYANVDAQIWDANGALRVISRQLVAEFSSPRETKS